MIFVITQTVLPNPGDEFRYSVTSQFPGSKPKSGMEIDTYTKAVLEGKPCIEKTKRTQVPGTTRKIVLTSHTWLRATSSTIQEIASSVANYPLHMTPDGPVTPTNLKLGLSWRRQAKDKDGFSLLSRSKVMRQEKILTPAGPFQCWVVETNIKESDISQTETLKRTDWWSLTLKRPVKSVMAGTISGEGHTSMTSTLVSYSLVNGKSRRRP